MDDREELGNTDRDPVAVQRWSLDAAGRKPVPEQVADRIVELVRSGELPRGARLPTEPELARRLGVARSSVRTGLQRLQTLGVVEVNRGVGWFVCGEPGRATADLMLERMAEREFDVLDIMEVRISLEGTAAALAAVRASPGQLDEIAKLSKSYQNVSGTDRDALLEADEEFHSAIVAATGNSYLRAVYGLITPLLAEWRRDSYATPAVHERSGIDHNQIAVQLRRRDEVGARLTMTSHLMGLYLAAHRELAGGEPADRPVTADVPAYVDVRDSPLWTGGG